MWSFNPQGNKIEKSRNPLTTHRAEAERVQRPDNESQTSKRSAADSQQQDCHSSRHDPNLPSMPYSSTNRSSAAMSTSKNERVKYRQGDIASYGSEIADGRCDVCGGPTAYTCPARASRERDGHIGRSNDDRPKNQKEASGTKNLIQKGWKNFQDGLKNDFKEPNEAVIRSEEQYQQMQDDIDSLEDRAERQIIKISALTSKLHNEQKNSHKLKESNNKVLLAMENKNLFVGRQDSDETVISQFGWLIGQIKTWSVPFAGEERTLPPSGYPPIHAESIRRIAPNVKDIGRFLQSPKCARLFVRGWVSLVMTETLFRTLPIDSKSQIPKEDIWMESSLADAVHTIEMNLLHADRQSVTLRDLHDWRALTTSLVSKQISKNKTSNDVENKVNECLKRIMDVVGPLAPEGKIAQLEHDLHGLLLQAVKLSQTLRCQRASWSVRHVVSLEAASLDGPVVLDDSIMEDVPNDRDHESDISRVPYRIVEVVVTPALFKKGNTDGEQYDVESCVGQAEVRSKAPAVVTNSGDRKRRNHK